MFCCDLNRFLKNHTIVSIGKIASQTCIAVEVITDNPFEFVECILRNNCYISEIRWWERTHIALKPKIGYGGPRDSRDPQNYYFAETDICHAFEKTTTVNEYFDYLNKIKAQYHMYDLYPAFDIYMK